MLSCMGLLTCQAYNTATVMISKGTLPKYKNGESAFTCEALHALQSIMQKENKQKVCTKSPEKRSPRNIKSLSKTQLCCWRL